MTDPTCFTYLLNIEHHYVIYMLFTTLVFMLLFRTGASPDAMRDAGPNWVEPDWVATSAVEPAFDHQGGQQ